MRRCQSCHKGPDLQPYEVPRRMHGVDVIGIGQQCVHCKWRLPLSFADVRRQENEVAEKIVERGIRDGAEFKFVRKVADIKSSDLADLMGVRAGTVSRWENRGKPIPVTAAFVLGELYSRPQAVREKLAAIARGFVSCGT